MMGVPGATWTTIDLCLSVFSWAPFRKAKAARYAGEYSAFIHISDGKMNEVDVLDYLLPEPGAFYIMDRGYFDFDRLHHLHTMGSLFAIRAMSNLKFQRRYSSPVDRETGLICDQTVVLTGFYSLKDYETLLRRIRFKDPETVRPSCF